MTTTNEPVEIYPLRMDKAHDEFLGDFRVIPVPVDDEEVSPKDSSAPASAAPSVHEVEPLQTEQADLREPTSKDLEEILQEQTEGLVPSEPTLPTSPPAPPAPPASVAKATKK